MMRWRWRRGGVSIIVWCVLCIYGGDEGVFWERGWDHTLEWNTLLDVFLFFLVGYLS